MAKRRLKDLWLMGVFVGLASTAISAFAGYKLNVSLNEIGDTLALEIVEKELAPNSCDSYVSAFSYVPGASALTVEVRRNPCFVNRVGHNRASFSWQLPTDLRQEGRLCLIVNEKPAGLLVLQDSTAAITPATSCH